MSAFDTSDKNPKQIASVANEQTSNLFDKLLDANVPSENIETTCDTNKNCETCIILPNTIKSELSSQSDEIEGYTLGNQPRVGDVGIGTDTGDVGIGNDTGGAGSGVDMNPTGMKKKKKRLQEKKQLLGTKTRLNLLLLELT